ncbi:MAG TPA: hypothetical protein VD905_12015 [Flavobacteriales bacterium]|nr:hypothetical protein [Flavobacteriales bacterium]
MNKLFWVFALMGLILYGCASNEKDKATEKKHDNDSVKNVMQKKPLAVDGPYTETYPDGQIKIQGEIKNGTRFGHWKAFYPNGNLQSECYYEDGKMNGKSATFYKNGRVRYIGYYRWNEPTGTWEFYDSTGTLANKKEYK